MITDEEAAGLVYDAWDIMEKLKDYCSYKYCEQCQFHGKYSELTRKYHCTIGDLVERGA